MVKGWQKVIGSGLFTGYIPLIPGTFGSLAALIIYLIPGFEKPLILIPVIIVSSFLGIMLGNKFETAYGKDPSQFTFDEFVGMWISLLFVPKTTLNLIWVFFIWRIFDIIKPFPARRLESLEGGLGIMADDIISGIYTLVIAQILLNIF